MNGDLSPREKAKDLASKKSADDRISPRHDAMKSLSHCGLFLYKHLNTLVLRSYTANLKRSYLFSNRMPWFAFM